MIKLDGKSLAREIEEKLKTEIKELDLKATLVIIQVGDIAESNTYIKLKISAAERIAIKPVHIKLPQNISQEELVDIVKKQCQEDIDGLIVQLPLPKHVNSYEVLKAIDPAKDVDGLNPYSLGELFWQGRGFAPATPKGVITLLKKYNIDLKGSSVVIVGRSAVVGKPLAALFLNEGATVTICHSQTKDLSGFTRRADIVVSAVGKPNMIQGHMVKKGVIAIDVGFSRVDGKSVGDLAYDVADKAEYLSPVPGGVGPMTVITLLQNILEASKNKQ